MNPPSVEQSLAEPTRPSLGARIAKNLHLVIPGAVLVVLSAALLIQAQQEETQLGPAAPGPSEDSIKDASQVEFQAPSGLLEDELERQRDRHVERGRPAAALQAIGEEQEQRHGAQRVARERHQRRSGAADPQQRQRVEQQGAIARGATERQRRRKVRLANDLLSSQQVFLFVAISFRTWVAPRKLLRPKGGGAFFVGY